jgi:hypothetical protein
MLIPYKTKGLLYRATLIFHLTILSMAGLYNKPVQYRRDSAHKSRAQGDPSSLGDYMYAIQHISKEENETISGA